MIYRNQTYAFTLCSIKIFSFLFSSVLVFLYAFSVRIVHGKLTAQFREPPIHSLAAAAEKENARR